MHLQFRVLVTRSPWINPGVKGELGFSFVRICFTYVGSFHWLFRFFLCCHLVIVIFGFASTDQTSDWLGPKDRLKKYLCRNFRTSSTATRRTSYRRTWSGWPRRGWMGCVSTSTRRRASIHSSAPNSTIQTNGRHSKNVSGCVSDCSAETSSGTCTTSSPRWQFRQWTPSSTERSRAQEHRYGRRLFTASWCDATRHGEGRAKYELFFVSIRVNSYDVILCLDEIKYLKHVMRNSKGLIK